MARIIYSHGDVFSFKEGGTEDNNYGVVIGENEAVLVTVGDRSQGWLAAKGLIPDTSLPILNYPNGVPFQVQLVIKGVKLMSEVPDQIEKFLDFTQIDFTHITFTFEGTSYRLDQTAVGNVEIMIPDGRILIVDSWSESFPAQPAGVRYSGRNVQMPLAVKA